MKLYPGVITEKLAESRDFYREVFGFTVKFEADWFVLLHAPGAPEHEIAFMRQGLETQHSVFRGSFGGQGLWIALPVPDVDAEYTRIRTLPRPVQVLVEPRTEDWGERHFTVLDPNGIGVDVVRYLG